MGPPKTPQSNTLLNYFSKTPRSEGLEERSPRALSSSKKKSPSQDISSPVSTNSKKRPLSGAGSPTGDASKKRKRIDFNANCSPGSSEFREGALVWALLEGFPWWAAMIRPEIRGGPFSRCNETEYHVQFFDDPPSRAWIRKVDLKIYDGSQDGKVQPSRFDPAWVSACRDADEARSFSPKKRLERYWVEFDIGEEGDYSEEEPPKAVPEKKSANRQKPRRRIIIESSSDEEEPLKNNVSKKRNKPNQSNQSNSDIEYKPTATKSESSESESEHFTSEELSTPDEDDEDMETGNNKRRVSKTSSIKVSGDSPRISAVKTPVSKLATSSPASRLDSPRIPASKNLGDTPSTKSWSHLSFSFLQPDKIMDNRKRPSSDPDYDPRTLFVPISFLDSQTPAHRQWWLFKSQNFDSVLFFKVGKFYELFYMDAIIGVEQLGLQFMGNSEKKDCLAHAGFPEIAVSKMQNILIDKGYKVARIEQTETPEMMNQRCSKTKTTKFDKVVKREICQIGTKGVRMATFQDDMNVNPFTPQASYLYAICENIGPSGIEYGVCFIDTTIGKFYVGQFNDDKLGSRLMTMLSHYPPVQILLERNKVSQATLGNLENLCSVRKDYLLPKTEFWEPLKLLTYLWEVVFTTEESVPETFKTLLSQHDIRNMTPVEEYELGLKSMGAVVYYLKACLMDYELLTLCNLEIYIPPDTVPKNQDVDLFPSKNMVLDGVTLKNLDVISGPASLLSVLDTCMTAFGKRLLREWVCLPLTTPEMINYRLDCIDDLNMLKLCDETTKLLQGLPDLERLLNKIHYLGSSHRKYNHPDGRAFYFEEVKYSRNKIHDLIKILTGFKTCCKIRDLYSKLETQGKVAAFVCDKFPDVKETLNYFDTAFDHSSALKQGKIIPPEGMVPEYDNVIVEIQEISSDSEEYLKNLRRELRCRVEFFGSDKKRFQLEIPENIKVPKHFELSSSRKGFKRYVNSQTKDFLSRLLKAESVREELLRDVVRRIFARFDEHKTEFREIIKVIGSLDALICLARFSSTNMCRPKLSYSDKPFILIEDGRHPCVTNTTYVPNPCSMGEKGGLFILLTGPNMGGKSTYMRQVALITLLAQIGCYVPASRCEMSVVDRIFTRIGANDNIAEGQSTFLVEMSETNIILKNATQHSLILIDELGRGTSTHDGTAIAQAVAKYLVSSVRARTMFSTHYHRLIDDLESCALVKLLHMACKVENENCNDPTQETITFMYKATAGACPKSYGFNAASLAGIMDDVIRVAHKKAKEMEQAVQRREMLLLTKKCSPRDIRSFIKDRDLKSKSASEFASHIVMNLPKVLLGKL